jgi:tryptophan synthase alpha chain
MSRIAEKFRELSEKGEGALIVYITGGDPSMEVCRNIIWKIAEDADILEIGIPFSDPIADGPVIQSASQRALNSGANVKKILKLVKEFRSSWEKPVAVLTYYNIILRFGQDRFVKELSRSGGDGIIVADLPLEEAGELKKISSSHSIDLILLAAPLSSMKRMKMIASSTSGFLYLVSLLGVTGAREKLSERLPKLLKLVPEGIPVAVGFGISRPEHVRDAMKLGASGVIVGSAVVKIIQDNLHDEKEMLRKIKKYVAEMKNATRYP